MFRRSASLAIPHLKSFAAIPSVSLVQLGHTNRSVFLSHESQCEIALVWALSRPIPYYQQGEVGEEKWACVFATFVFLTFRGPLASHDSNPYPNRNRIARYNATKVGVTGTFLKNCAAPWAALLMLVQMMAGGSTSKAQIHLSV